VQVKPISVQKKPGSNAQQMQSAFRGKTQTLEEQKGGSTLVRSDLQINKKVGSLG
jgi:hypothetical protein